MIISPTLKTMDLAVFSSQELKYISSGDMRSIIVFILAFSSCFNSYAQQKKKPNIIIILADDLGYGDIGCYGQEKIKTPHIDSLAKMGVRFTQFYSGSTVCAPARCTFLSGM